MKFNNKPNKQVKLENGTIWISRSVATCTTVAALVDNEFYLLVGVRGNMAPDHIGKRNLICGYLDYNETVEDCAIREIWEETGLNILTIMQNEKIIHDGFKLPWRVGSKPNKGAQNVTLHYTLIFEADELPRVSTENAEPGEIAKVQWMRLIDAKTSNPKDWAFNHHQLVHDWEAANSEVLYT